MATRILDPQAGDAAYETDVAAWCARQAELMRRGEVRHLDWPNLIEEIESLGSEQEHAVESHLARIIEHLLKLDHSADANPRRVWRVSVRTQRVLAQRRLNRNPSLRARLNHLADEAWDVGIGYAALGLSESEAAVISETRCYSPQQLLDPAYFGERDATA